MNYRRSTRGQVGFSLLEMVIVIAIIMVVAVMAVPKIMSNVADIRLRGAVNSASGIIQEARMIAIKNNLTEQVKYSNTASGGTVYAKNVNDTSSLSSTDPQVQMGSTVLAYSTPTGVAALSATDLSYTATTVTSIMFNPRGIPCSAVNTCGAGMVFYFTDSRTVGSPGWAAVSVSPAGRVKTWMWNGNKWAD